MASLAALSSLLTSNEYINIRLWGSSAAGYQAKQADPKKVLSLLSPEKFTELLNCSPGLVWHNSLGHGDSSPSLLLYTTERLVTSILKALGA